MNTMISIIIPIYNTDYNSLRRCINSCLQQTYNSIEILIICNGTNLDEFKKIEKFKEHDKRIDVINLKEKGVSNARNIGIHKAKGHWITFVDADDYIEKNYCERLYQATKSKQCDIVISSFYKNYTNRQEECSITNSSKIINQEEFLNKILNVQNGIGFVWGKLWNKNFILNNRINFNNNLVVAEDAEFCIKAATYFPSVVMLPDALYHYVISNESTVRTFNENYANNYEFSMAEIYGQLSKNKLINKTYLFNFIAYHLLLICVNYCFNPQNTLSYRDQKRLLKKAISKKIFYESVKNSKLRDFSFSRSVSLLMLKCHFYFAVKLISTIRHKQR